VNPVQSALSAHYSSQKATAGGGVTITPQAGAAYTAIAILLDVDNNDEDAQGVTVPVESRDFGFITADLAGMPGRGDVIEFDGDKYEVMGGPSGPPYSYMDQYKVGVRVRTRNVSLS
jgi:hypothetical protein